MCGIFGYVGQDNASEVIVQGLKRLEYRGYDSWGTGVIADNGIKVAKKVGAIGDLEAMHDMSMSHIGIGHTRWATHGGVTYNNAHPHYSKDKGFVLAQNGIVDNYQALKAELTQDGYTFTTETDTEVIVALVERYMSEGQQLTEAVIAAFNCLKGRNTIIVLSSQDDHIVAVRNGSPLVVGVADDAYYFASDTLSFADKTDKVVFVENGQMVEYVNGALSLHDVKTSTPLETTVVELDQEMTDVDKEGYPHFMLKEIFEEQHILVPAVDYSMKELTPLLDAIKSAQTVFTLGSGGAFYAADQVAYFLRTMGGVKAIGVRGYEMESYAPLIQKGDVVIAISQSGETADTIRALEVFKAKGVLISSVVNMLGSTISRMSDYPYYSRSGSEICVLSTKSGVAQVAFGYLLGQSLAGNHASVTASVEQLQTYLQKHYLNDDYVGAIRNIASTIASHEHIFILGKGANAVVAQLAALNIKEASYVHAEGFCAGELKHGVIALIEKGTPVISFVDDDNDREYMLGATAEVKSRGAFVVGVAAEDNELFDEMIPLPTQSGIDSARIANVLPCQLLAYFLAVLKGYNPDKPRNLAKSVTVL